MILIIDNYDSFVFNVARYFAELGQPTKVVRNDQVVAQDLNARAIVISPGPCAPEQAGASMQIIRDYSGKLPILGICLGHQAIGAVFGAKVVRAKNPMHGEGSEISHTGKALFENLPQKFSVGRYHSLIVEQLEGTELLPTAWSETGEIMGLQHQNHPTYGVQFHPESILTEHGYDLLRNFLKVVK
jgi:para-aminobenzoate synthetase component II